MCPSPSSCSPHFQSGPRTTRRPTSRRITDAELVVDEDVATVVEVAADPGGSAGPAVAGGDVAGWTESVEGEVDVDDGMTASGLRRPLWKRKEVRIYRE